MQLLDSEQLEYAFQRHGITLEAEARKFYADIWQTIKDAERASDGADMLTQEKKLREICQSYFSVTQRWQQEEEDRHENDEICALSRDNAREAFAILPKYEKQFFRYALCYMELNRTLIRARAKIQYFAKDYNLDDHSNELDVNHGTGVLLERAQKEAATLQEKRKHLEQMKHILRTTDPLMEKIGKELPLQFSTEGDRQLTLFKGSLRRCEFDRAQQLVRGWKREKLRVVGYTVIDAIKKNAVSLKVHEGIVLHSGELSLMSSTLRGDESKAYDFLEKFNIPYMVFQYRALIQLGYMLGKIGSIEGLIIQHGKLLSISSRPHNDSDYAKKQEVAIMLPVRIQMEHNFTTLAAIFNDMEITLHTLDRLVTQTRDFMAHGTQNPA